MKKQIINAINYKISDLACLLWRGSRISRFLSYKSFFVFRLFIFLMGLGTSSLAAAAVFKCVDQEGKIEFRDHPCKNEAEIQSVLPIRYEKTQAKVVKQQQVLLKIQEKDLNKQEKKELRQSIQAEKQREKEERKAKRLEIRCNVIRAKMKDIQSRLRAGCSAKRSQRLRDQELSLIAKEREVCVKS